jgi:hypothetical protein
MNIVARAGMFPTKIVTRFDPRYRSEKAILYEFGRYSRHRAIDDFLCIKMALELR